MVVSADRRREHGKVPGASDQGGRADAVLGSGSPAGPPSRHVDAATAELDRLARTWIDLQQTRKALDQRELPAGIVDEFARLEEKVARLLQRALRRHALWPWLSQYPGLGGAHVALVIGRIGDPRRFPGQRCSEGHYLPPTYAVGAPCPVLGVAREVDGSGGDGTNLFPATESADAIKARRGGGKAGADEDFSESGVAAVCPGLMLPPRTTTGVRSLWHWAGLHVEETGRAPRKRKGTKGDWEPRVRASVMQPGGIAEQIVRHTVPRYAEIYRAAKERLAVRVAERASGIGQGSGDATTERATDVGREIEGALGRPLRPFEADRIARKIAAKAFLGDLLVEWKRLLG